VDRVRFELGGIVGIRVAAGEAEAALADEGGEVVFDLPRLAPLGEAGRQLASQLEFVVDRLEEDRSAIGALLRGIEGRHQGLVEELGEQQRLHTLFGHSCASSVKGSACVHRG